MAMDPKYARRQKEIARNAAQAAKREERARRRNEKPPEDDGVAAIQAAIDAGLTPGTAAERTGPPAEGAPETSDSDGDDDEL